MGLRFYIGLLLAVEVVIFGFTWLMGYDLAVKEKIKIIIETNFIFLLLAFSVYLMITGR